VQRNYRHYMARTLVVLVLPLSLLAQIPAPSTQGGGSGGGGGGGVTSVSGTSPIASSGGSTPAISVGVAQGNGSKIQLSTGSTTTNDCVKFDANGNTVDAGGACGSGSGPTLQTNGTNNSSQTTLNIQNGTNTTASNPSGGNVQVNVAGASSSAKGVVQGDGSTLTINGSNVISCTTATTSQIGCVKPDGTTITISSGVISGSSGITLQTNGTNNSSQTALNLVNGANCTVTNSSGSTVSFTCSQTNITGNAATATNLASYPSLCSGGQFSQGLSSGSNNCGIPSSQAPSYTTVSFSSTPTFTVGSNTEPQEFQITLTGNVTSSTLTTTSATTGQTISFKICQDATGSRTFTWPSNVVNPGSIPTTASTCGKQIFVYDGTDAVAFGPMVADGSTPGIQTPTGFLTLPTGTTTITQTVTSGTATLGTSAISSGACASTVTVSASGVASTDDIIADFNATPLSTTGYEASANGMLTIIKWPTSGNVNFAVCNNTANSVTPGAVTLNWRVVR
jgi:hypothetical protein